MCLSIGDLAVLVKYTVLEVKSNVTPPVTSQLPLVNNSYSELSGGEK